MGKVLYLFLVFLGYSTYQTITVSYDWFPGFKRFRYSLPKVNVTEETTTTSVLPVLAQRDNRRPIYNIAHMTNSIAEVQNFLDRGANAIETDVEFYNNGSACCVHHGFPCDCLRECDHKEDFSTFLEYIRSITTPGNKNFRKELVLVFFDLKVSDLDPENQAIAGEYIANSLMEHLWKTDRPQSQVNVLLSIGHSSDKAVVKTFLETLSRAKSEDFIKKRIGWDIGMNDDITEMQEVWTSLNVSGNVWIGDGVTNCLSFLRPYRRLARRIRERDSNTRFSKVYAWTVDLSSLIQYTLGLGIDAIMTNYPENVVKILNQTNLMSRMRLATIEDNPWKIFVHKNAVGPDSYVDEHESSVNYWDFIKSLALPEF